MTDKCPYCGAPADPEQSGWKVFYQCKTGIDDEGEVFRGKDCYEAELAALRSLVREVAEWFHHMRPELDKEDGFSVYVNSFFDNPVVKKILEESDA